MSGATLTAAEAGREPYRLDFGPAGDMASLREYESAWYLWRAIARDGTMTNAEWPMVIEALEWAMARRKAGERGCWS